jgi:hypothetical protein
MNDCPIRNDDACHVTACPHHVPAVPGDLYRRLGVCGHNLDDVVRVYPRKLTQEEMAWLLSVPSVEALKKRQQSALRKMRERVQGGEW